MVNSSSTICNPYLPGIRPGNRLYHLLGEPSSQNWCFLHSVCVCVCVCVGGGGGGGGGVTNYAADFVLFRKPFYVWQQTFT